MSGTKKLVTESSLTACVHHFFSACTIPIKMGFITLLIWRMQLIMEITLLIYILNHGGDAHLICMGYCLEFYILILFLKRRRKKVSIF
jgi:lipid-A-disaccharide synthase-like uncharacterized protein